MDNHLFLPVVVPLLGAVVTILLRGKRILARGIFLLIVPGYLGYSGWLLWHIAGAGRQVAMAGSWPPPDGITLVADGLSAIMLFLSALLMLAGAFLGFVTLDEQREGFFFYPLLLLLLGSLGGVFTTGDIFSLYIWSEAVLLASFALLTLGGERAQVEGGLKYLVLNILGSMVLLVGCGLLHGTMGTLNMALLAKHLGTTATPGLKTVLASLILVAFVVRAAIFPSFFWLPASSHVPPVAVSAILVGLLTRPAIYALFRLFPLLFPGELLTLSPILALLAALTIGVGFLAAFAQGDLRRMLAFDSIGQQGYILLGLVLAAGAGAMGLAAGIFLLIHAMVAHMALLLVGGTLEHLAGTTQVRRIGGLLPREPVVAVLWFLGFLVLAGFPPLSGFFGRLALLNVAILYQEYLLVAVIIVGSLLGLLPMLRVWNGVFWRQSPQQERSPSPEQPPPQATMRLIVPGGVLVALCVALAVWVSPAMDYSLMAATQAMDGGGYISDVLGVAGAL